MTLISKPYVVCVCLTEVLLASSRSYGNGICAVCCIVRHCCSLWAVSWLARYTDLNANRTAACWLRKISADEWSHLKRFCHSARLCHHRILLAWTQAVTLTRHQVRMVEVLINSLFCTYWSYARLFVSLAYFSIVISGKADPQLPGLPSCHPTNSVKALKDVYIYYCTVDINNH